MQFLRRLVTPNNFVISSIVKFYLNLRNFIILHVYDCGCKIWLNVTNRGCEIIYLLLSSLWCNFVNRIFAVVIINVMIFFLFLYVFYISSFGDFFSLQCLHFCCFVHSSFLLWWWLNIWCIMFEHIKQIFYFKSERHTYLKYVRAKNFIRTSNSFSSASDAETCFGVLVNHRSVLQTVEYVLVNKWLQRTNEMAIVQIWTCRQRWNLQYWSILAKGW